MTYIQDLTTDQQTEYAFIAQLLTLGRQAEFYLELKKFKTKHGIK